MLEKIKAHLRIDHDIEDTLLLTYWDAAEQAIMSYTGLEDLVAAPVEAAVLLLVADLYTHREKNSERALHENPTYQALLNPYRRLVLS